MMMEVEYNLELHYESEIAYAIEHLKLLDHWSRRSVDYNQLPIKLHEQRPWEQG